MPLLTTVQQVKDYLVGIAEPIPAGHEETVTFFIRSASDKFENECKRRFQKQTYSGQLYFGIGTRESWEAAGYPVRSRTLWLREWPVVSVASVSITYGSVTTTVVEGTLDANWKKVRDERGDWVGLYREDGWASDPMGISVTYDAGYVLPSDAGVAAGTATRDLPYDVEEAVAAIAGGSYQHRGRTMVPSESFEGLSQQIDRWPLWILKIIGQYKRRGV